MRQILRHALVPLALLLPQAAHAHPTPPPRPALPPASSSTRPALAVPAAKPIIVQPVVIAKDCPHTRHTSRATPVSPRRAPRVVVTRVPATTRSWQYGPTAARDIRRRLARQERLVLRAMRRSELSPLRARQLLGWNRRQRADYRRAVSDHWFSRAEYLALDSALRASATDFQLAWQQWRQPSPPPPRHPVMVGKLIRTAHR